MIGEIDSSGSLNAHSLLHLTERVRSKAVFQVRSFDGLAKMTMHIIIIFRILFVVYLSGLS